MAKKTDITNKSVTVSAITIQSAQQRIFTVRGQQVMMDRDLAQLYGVETKVLNQAVKRNMERFPSEFMFQPNHQELANLKSQFVTARWGGDRRTPYLFTEQGVAMLSAVLKSPTAISVSIGIMNAFVAARRILAQHDEHEMAISELRMRMKMLEDALENNLGAVNDLSEEMRHELDNIYNAIGALSVKQQSKQKPLPPIGYEAIDAERKKDQANSKKDQVKSKKD